MRLKLVTITGVDERTNPLFARRLSERFPFIEFAMLVSESSGGKKPRYMTVPDVIRMLGMLRAHQGPKLAVHICGKWSRLLLEGRADELGATQFQHLLRQGALLMDHGRVQWNINPANVKRDKWNIPSVINILHECFYNGNLILQRHNLESADLSNALRATLAREEYLHHRLHIDVLHDLSGGHGVVPEGIPPPIGMYCGYAGGFSPENVGVRLRQLAAKPPENGGFWIDMESGVRTDDWLDLKKVEHVLEVAAPYVEA